MEAPVPAADACADCAQPLTGPYCAHCGARKYSREDQRLGPYLRRFAQDKLHLDGKLPRTLWLLLSRPGHLTAEAHAGRGRPWWRWWPRSRCS